MARGSGSHVRRWWTTRTVGQTGAESVRAARTASSVVPGRSAPWRSAPEILKPLVDRHAPSTQNSFSSGSPITTHPPGVTPRRSSTIVAPRATRRVTSPSRSSLGSRSTCTQIPRRDAPATPRGLPPAPAPVAISLIRAVRMHALGSPTHQEDRREARRELPAQRPHAPRHPAHRCPTQR
jgi:hypothetical protein